MQAAETREGFFERVLNVSKLELVRAIVEIARESLSAVIVQIHPSEFAHGDVKPLTVMLRAM